ncbi:hypothetical protein QC761_710540 [Podospora bellae-mahoneyi]|uniref:Uncharacterized protein n=1 Tax=Podospora bellae-mahoneyi TaxID=2093777 RepID=A0ABR0F6P5_9PEZI|nr:hypothetical protein QC761_710540 [Podospora bellae-mahoneyi]
MPSPTSLQFSRSSTVGSCSVYSCHHYDFSNRFLKKIYYLVVVSFCYMRLASIIPPIATSRPPAEPRHWASLPSHQGEHFFHIPVMNHRLRLTTSLDSCPGPSSQGISTALETMHEESESVHSGHRSPMSGGTAPSAFEDDHGRRRSSTFSVYSLNEAGRGLHDEILDPGPFIHQSEVSWGATLPLVFALLPALVGLVFKNGSSVITDLILLGLAAVFLHWSVTVPWKWYHASQQVREEEGSVVESAFQDESGSDDAVSPRQQNPGPDEQQPSQPDPQTSKMDRRAKTASQALTLLGLLECAALLACFVAPGLAAWMLHHGRNLLSRGSEGLVSNFNLVIFFIAAEISPVSHFMKLIQAQTLHLQRLVHSNSNPYRQEKVTMNQWRELIARLDELETRGLTNAPSPVEADTRRVHASLVREVRNQIQPDIDALNRAVRRYEKKARVLAVHTEGRLRDLRQRVDDAISLSAVVAGRGRKGTEWDLVGWCLGGAVWVLMLPVREVIRGLAKVLAGVGWLMGIKEEGGDEVMRGKKKGEMDGSQVKGKGVERETRRSGSASGSGASGGNGEMDGSVVKGKGVEKWMSGGRSGSGSGASGGKGYLGRRM